MTQALQPFFTMRAKRFCRSAPSGVVCSASSITAPSSYMTVPASPVFIPQRFSIACVMKPYVVAEVRDSTGKLIHKGERRVRYQVISKETSDFVRGAMRRVVAEGGGRLANSDRTEIAGKTGTAQIAQSGKYTKGQYVASFVGFWPAENPRYVMLISIGEPKGKQYYGGQIAAPVFKNIVEDVVQLSD